MSPWNTYYFFYSFRNAVFFYEPSSSSRKDITSSKEDVAVALWRPPGSSKYGWRRSLSRSPGDAYFSSGTNVIFRLQMRTCWKGLSRYAAYSITIIFVFVNSYSSSDATKTMQSVYHRWNLRIPTHDINMAGFAARNRKGVSNYVSDKFYSQPTSTVSVLQHPRYAAEIPLMSSCSELVMTEFSSSRIKSLRELLFQMKDLSSRASTSPHSKSGIPTLRA
ncbi:hypothetical protein ARMSODRAFT_1025694 [Armillaria solidipes]|uniref:Uncharacterized protein n=1 Tax=Armillaria solidipes TaxID=1076256 RepID=A0A2H3AXC7_9AGAR|nr:hypothetical protein ARMSODRAFT_1025694 [Armillaria solidipes]